MLPALISGGLSLLGGILGNRASAKQAAQQMDFQERLSGTAHQREVADLRAAGLNPILSGTGGAGSSTPGGAMAPQSDVISPAVSSALAARRNKAEVQLMEDQSWLAKSSAAKANQEAHESYARQNVLYETVKKEREAAEQQAWDAKAARWMYESSKAQGEFDKSIGEESRVGRFLLEILRGVRSPRR